MTGLSGVFDSVQKWLFPFLEEELGELNENQKEFVRVLELMDLPRHLSLFRYCGIGRKPEDRLCLLKGFVAKSVFGCATTKGLIEMVKSSPTVRRLCGWESVGELPSEATFSRAFTQFAENELPQKIHEGMIKKYLGPKLVGHISRDSTAIEAREKAVKKGEKPQDADKKRRLVVQPGRTLEENLADIPKFCDYGVKFDSNGNKMMWRGYKLHIDCADGDIPVSAYLSSASLHDSQLAIPLAQMTAERVVNLYDLMDSAYDAPEIKNYSAKLNHVPIIAHNKRRGEAKELKPAQQLRFRERSAVERVNSNLKDNYGGNNVRGRGYKKVFAHLMFGIITIAANQLYNLLL